MRAFIIAVLIILIAGGTMVALDVFKPKPEEQEVVPLVTPVEVVTAKRQDIQVRLTSQGLLEAKTLTTAASEVSGKVLEVLPPFEVGGQFESGQVLLRIDPADYESARAQAKSLVADAALAVKTEEAKATQSLRDWKKLGRTEEANALVKREPQLASARARLEAAEAGLAKAERDLERTVLRAPYRGRILRTHTDEASFVTMGAPLADFYRSDALEVKLPVSLSELPFLNLQTTERAVTLSTATGKAWSATVVRQDAEIDRRSRSLHLIAALPEETSANDPLLVPGLFVSAQIAAEPLKNVFPVDRKALLGEDEVLILGAEIPDPTSDHKFKTYTLLRRQVTVARKEAGRVLINEGIKEGERICISYVPNFIQGMTVRVLGEETKA